MTFVADESVDFPIIKLLRDNNYKVRSILEEFPAVPDEVVLGKASEGHQILLTLDKDFGELVFRLKLLHSGVVLIRLGGYQSKAKSRDCIESCSGKG